MAKKGSFMKKINKLLKRAGKMFKSVMKKYDKSSIWVKLFIIIAIVLLFLRRYNRFSSSTRRVYTNAAICFKRK